MELRDYLNVVRARRWVIIQAVVIVTLASVVVSMLLPPTYQGEARVLVAEKGAGSSVFGSILGDLSSQPERSLATQVQLMQLRPIAEQTIRKLGLKMRPDELLERVKVSALGQTNVVVITADYSSPRGAADIANTMADAFVEWSRASKRERIKAAADELEGRLNEARSVILSVGRRINRATDKEKAAAEAQAELQIAAGLYTTLAEKLEQLRIDEQLEAGSGSVVSRAVVVNTPVSPQPVRNGMLGLAIGLILGVGMAFLYEYLDNTIKSTDEAERLLGAPVLGHITLEKLEKGERRRLTIVDHPGSAGAEAYRVLRNSLDFINFEHDIKTLLITSAAPGEGKSTVAANLAAGLAQAGAKVVLVSCDFRKPTMDQFFGVSNSIGLSDVLTGSNTLKAALQRPGDEQLLILSSGKMPPNPSELLSSWKMEDLFKNLEDWADWVIVDSPPLLAVADAAAVARWADGVLMVTKGGSSTREAARKGREMLERVGARILGVVVWGLEEGGAGRGYGYYYEGYYGSYYYASYYTPLPGAKKQAKKNAQSSQGVEASGRDDMIYIPQESAGRRLAGFMGRVLTGVLSFLVVLTILGVVLYLVDRALGLGLVQMLYMALGRL